MGLTIIALLIALVLLLTTGCTYTPYTRQEKIWATVFVTGQVADTASTWNAFDHGYHEGNPVLSINPEMRTIIGTKLICTGAVFAIGEVFPKSRLVLFKIGSAVGWGATAWNIGVVATGNDQ